MNIYDVSLKVLKIRDEVDVEQSLLGREYILGLLNGLVGALTVLAEIERGKK
jgi:hypothetical protein